MKSHNRSSPSSFLRLAAAYLSHNFVSLPRNIQTVSTHDTPKAYYFRSEPKPRTDINKWKKNQRTFGNVPSLSKSDVYKTILIVVPYSRSLLPFVSYSWLINLIAKRWNNNVFMPRPKMHIRKTNTHCESFSIGSENHESFDKIPIHVCKCNY